MKVADKTVSTNLGFCSSGICANAANVDVLDGKIVRIRPLHYDEQYTKEDLNYWTLEKDGHVFEPGMQSFIGPFSLSYKKRAYSKNRVPYPLKRVDWDPHGDRHPETRGTSKYQRISWDEATDLIAEEIKRVQETYGPFSIYCQGEGHGESKNVAGGHGCQISMFDFIGRCTTQCRQTDSWEGWYWGAKHIWGMDPIGQQRWQRNVFKDITENGDAVLFWGADPETTPLGWGGQQASRMCFWFNDIGVKSIFICPDGYLYEPVWINPVDAEKHGIKQGDIVKIFNERGAVMGGAYVTERIMPGALSQDHGAREDLIETGTGGLDRSGANNLIAPDKTSSKNASGEVTNSFLVDHS